MTDPAYFSKILRKYLKRSPYSYGKLAERANLPKTTISNWANQYVKQPREWSDLAKLASVLELKEAEATELMEDAGFPSIEELLKSQISDIQQLVLASWSQSVEERLAGRVPFQAPSNILDFVGREKELKKLKESLVKNGQICVLHGIGGAGKTTLAIQLAYSLQPYFPDGVLWAQLGNAAQEGDTLNSTRLMTIMREFTQPFGYDVTEATDLLSRSEAMRKVLADKRVLIVLDNAEGTGDVEYLLPPTDTPSILITTRNQKMLRDRAEHIDISPFDSKEGELFLNKIIGLARVKDEHAAIEDIIQFTGGLPLALRVVAETLAEAPQVTVAEYCELLRDERTRLTHLADWEDATKNVRASLELSFRKLEEHLQQLFLSLAVFENNNFSIESVASVIETPLISAKFNLARLKSLSLIESSLKHGQTNLTQFRLHPLWLVFTYEKLGAIPRHLNENFIRYYLSFTQAHSSKKVASWKQLEAELPNLMLAIKKAVDLNNSQALSSMARILIQDSEFLNTRGYYSEAVKILSHLLTLQDSKNEQTGKIWTLNKLAHFTLLLGQHEAALRHANNALALARKMGDEEQEADSLLYLAHLSVRKGENKKAYDFWKQELTLRQQLDSPFRLANCYNSLGAIQLQLGYYNEANTLLEQALAYYPEQEDKTQVARVLSNKAVAALYLGEFNESIKNIEESLAICQVAMNRELTAQNLQNKGLAQYHTGNVSDSLKNMLLALEQWQTMGDKISEALTLIALAEVNASLGNITRSMDLLQSVTDLLDFENNNWIEVDYLHALGFLYAKDGAYEEALQSYERLEILAEKWDFPYYVVQGKLGVAQACLALAGQEHLVRSQKEASWAIDACQKLALKGSEPRAHAYLGKTYLLLNNPILALHHCQLAANLLEQQVHIHGSETELHLFILQILEKGSDAEAFRTHLERAHGLILDFAERTYDEDLRYRILNDPVNREIVRRYENSSAS